MCEKEIKREERGRERDGHADRHVDWQREGDKTRKKYSR